MFLNRLITRHGSQTRPLIAVTPDGPIPRWRLSGVTASLVEQSETDKEQLVDAFCEWSSSYPHFTREECVEKIEEGRDRIRSGKHMGNWPTLLEMVAHDNPSRRVVGFWGGFGEKPSSKKASVEVASS